MFKPILRRLDGLTEYDRYNPADESVGLWWRFGTIMKNMKNPFTVHPLTKGQTYFEHLLTASNIGLRLLISALAFFLHSVFPFISIPQSLNLEAVALFLLQENQLIDTRWQAAKLAPIRE